MPLYFRGKIVKDRLLGTSEQFCACEKHLPVMVNDFLTEKPDRYRHVHVSESFFSHRKRCDYCEKGEKNHGNDQPERRTP